jgi:hypothetical protein
VPQIYRYQYLPRGRPPFPWIPGFCCALPAGCCLLWALLVALAALLALITLLHHL